MDSDGRLLGYLFYYEKSKRFFTELLEELDEWTAPFIFSTFVREGIFSIDSEWSMKFVRQRIIPGDRQNLGAILRDNKLSVYDEYKLLQLSEGRCAQDELFLVRISVDKILPEIRERFQRKVRDVMPMKNQTVTIFFMDDTSRIINLKETHGAEPRFAHLMKNDDLFKNVKVSPGGNGIEWGEERFIPADFLYYTGHPTALCYTDLLTFVKNRIADTTEVTEMLNCSRQYINQLSGTGKLTPVKSGSNNNLYLKSDIEKDY